MELVVLDYTTGVMYTILDAPVMNDPKAIEEFIDNKLELRKLNWMIVKNHIYHHCNPQGTTFKSPATTPREKTNE